MWAVATLPTPHPPSHALPPRHHRPHTPTLTPYLPDTTDPTPLTHPLDA